MDLLLYLAQQGINGLTLGSVYALAAIGLSMVYGLLRLVNFAHGDLLMVGAYVALALLATGSVAAAAIAPIIAVGLLGMGIERAAYRPIRQAPEVAALIVSLALSVLVQNLFVMTVTAQPRSFRPPAALTGIVAVGPFVVHRMAIVTLVTAAALLAVLQLFVTRSRVGIALRACADDLTAVKLMGASTDRLIMLAFGVAGALAGAAGTMLGGLYGRIDPFMGFLPGLKAFVAAVIGGLGSLPGAVLGGYLLGLAEILFVGLLPPAFSAYRDALVFGLLMLVLLARPQGLLGAGA